MPVSRGRTRYPEDQGAVQSAGRFQRGAAYHLWRPPGVNTWLLFATQGGAGRLRAGDHEVAALPRTLLLYRHGVGHDYATVQAPWRFLWVHFLPPPRWLDWLDWPAAAPGIGRLVIDDDAAWERICRHLGDTVDHRERSGRLANALAENACEAALLAIAAAIPAGAMDARIRRCLERIEARPHERLGIPALAAIAGLSPSRFAHLFRAQTGETPQRLVERACLARACQLLRSTDLPLAEVARRVGFTDRRRFTARFRRAMGAAPREWRRRG